VINSVYVIFKVAATTNMASVPSCELRDESYGTDLACLHHVWGWLPYSEGGVDAYVTKEKLVYA